MTDFIRLQAHYIVTNHRGTAVGSLVLTMTVDGATVEMPSPFVPLGDHLGIAPVVTPDGNGVRIDVTRWSPVKLGPDVVARFPFNVTGQDVAARIARAFDGDPGTTWQATPDEIRSWLRRWDADNGAALFPASGGAS